MDRVRVRVRRASVAHFGEGAFLGAQCTGITTVVGASVPMLVSLVVRRCVQPHSPGHEPYLSSPKRLITVDHVVGIGAECPLKTLLALVLLTVSPLYSTPLTACESAASSRSITVIVLLSATPKAAPFVPTLYV